MRQITGWHRLWLELGRYLIAFDPLTFVLDQWKHTWHMLSLLDVFKRSKNFTSSAWIHMPPSVSIYHQVTFETNITNTTPCYIIPCTTIPTGRLPLALLFFQSKHRPSSINLWKSIDFVFPSSQREPLALALEFTWPFSDYELFNHSNISIRYWSWNYRGCWHQTCPPIVPR